MKNSNINLAVNEVELKLALPSAHTKTLLTHPMLAGTAPLKQYLVNTYFDTLSGDLAKSKVAVRLRQIDDRILQTVKTAGHGGGGLSSRQEWEWQLTSQQLDQKALQQLPPFQGKLAAHLGQLAPTLRTDFTRHSWQLTWQGSQIELVLDEGEITSGNARALICEIELELKAGEPEALWSLALTLSENVPLRPSDSSKAARGNALAAKQWALPEASTPTQWLHRATVALDAYHDSGQNEHLRAAQHALNNLAAHPELDVGLNSLAQQLNKALNADGQPSTAYGYTALTLANRLAAQTPLR
ncbi:MAG: CYTH domain-containing protein [Halomonas sp.]|uniref:CYTH domain-containing protein n=1 Tax=unclassified Halomonas TaxID=2609666 RepID=UPI0009907740|nr:MULTISPECIES: CYTH domain-containing protein [unclassified Halomonas]AQU83362.1 adenylate cyclase [Halomonas sp. 'Soap Lake \